MEKQSDWWEIDGWMVVWMNGQMDGWIEEGMEGGMRCMARWTDGEMEQLMGK